MPDYVIRRLRDEKYWTGLGWDVKSRAKRYQTSVDLDLVLHRGARECLFVRYDSSDPTGCHYVGMDRVKKAVIEQL